MSTPKALGHTKAPVASSYGPSPWRSTIHDEFARGARRHPQRIAVRGTTTARTYRELAEHANAVAAVLAQRGVRAGQIVPVIARRSLDLPAFLLGVLGNGAAYGMLDARWPTDRLNTLVERMNATVVIADPKLAAELERPGRTVISITELTDLPPAPRFTGRAVSPDTCSTVFWTSGSTGTPKAVLSPHHATTRLFCGPGYLDVGDRAVMINAAAVAWDAFTLEMWGMLLTGGTVLVHTPDVMLPSDLRYYIQELGATHVFMTPALADVLVAGDIDCLDGLRALLLGGDKPTQSTCLALRERYPWLQLINGYGPVESCVFATTHPIDNQTLASHEPIPVGTPVPGTGVHIIDNDGEIAAVGETGQVGLSGHGLALGYLDDPERTAEAFGTITIAGAPTRVYRTGDRGYLDSDGRLHFQGRADGQVKISGHRIEPAEIENAARAAGASRAVVLRCDDNPGVPSLVLVAEADAVGEKELLAELEAQLPTYMLPRRIHVIDAMPLLDNTKIDKRALTARYATGRRMQGATV